MEKKIKHLLKLIKLNENTLSMFFGIATVLLVSTLAFRMYKDGRPTITNEGENITASSTPTTKLNDVVVVAKDDELFATELPESYVVAAGDNLWKVAEKLYGSGYNWVDIAKENKIANPSQIEVGQKLVLPKVAIKMVASQKLMISAPSEKISIEGDSYTVAKGDTLWSISVRAYADGYRYPEIAKANNLKNMNVIEVGQVLKLPR